MSNQSYNLNIRFYGVQGSGSVFPSQAERLAQQDLMDLRLLEQVFTDLSKRTGPDGKLDCTIEELLGGDINRQTVRACSARWPCAVLCGLCLATNTAIIA